ncbi:MAG: hypothetical protein J7L54_05225 [Elusimicrobia bacterium]|nr:hypothetical protein [Elusimicrobiota bacterium]
MKKVYLLFFLVFSAVAFAAEKTVTADNAERLIFVPKAGGLNYGEYNVNFRIYTGGGIVARCVFGVIQGLDVGFSWDIQNLIGTDVIRGRNPNLYLKLDIFRGNFVFPQISIGYDKQGYGQWIDSTKKYQIPELGFFLVMSKEMIIPNLYITAGGNVNNSGNSDNKVEAFVGLNFKPSKFGVYADAIDIGKGKDICRVNAGALLEFTEGLQFMLGFENVTTAEKISSDIERTFSIIYHAAF